MKFLQLNFLPTSTDVALLVARVWFGASMLVLHGWGKLTGFGKLAESFPDLFGIGKAPTAALAVFGEVVCAALLVAGLFTRVAAGGLAVTMAVAFFMAHGGKLTGQGNGEMAFLYLGAYVVLFCTGGGRFAVDAKLGGKS